MGSDRRGAFEYEWDAFINLDLVRDILPTVCNPDAPRLPTSVVKDLSKVPSRYYGSDRLAGGISKWTELEATERMVRSWREEDDYGLLIQSRLCRGFDIDVDDPELAAEYAEAFEIELGLILPRRVRSNSGKLLMPFILEGEPGQFPKEVLKVPGGMIEFLGDGRQWMACGTHSSGVRYEWEGGLPKGIPRVSVEQWQAAWQAMEVGYGLAPVAKSRVSDRSGTRLDVDDPIADWLEGNWETYGRDGEKLWVACPWRDRHSMDSGFSEAAWLLAGTRGHEEGHFSCLHAGCAKETRDSFLKATKAWECVVVPSMLDVMPDESPEDDEGGGDPTDGLVVVSGRGKRPDRPPAVPRDKVGAIEVSALSVLSGVSYAPWSGFDFSYDTFMGQLLVLPDGESQWRPISDADLTRVQVNLAKVGYKHQPKDLIRDVVAMHANDCAQDSAKQWLETGLPEWDGIPRCEGFATQYLGIEESEYARAASRYVWSAHVTRIRHPGCKADMVPVLVGRQGMRKSSVVEALCPDPRFFGLVNLRDKDADISRKLIGKLVIELDELRGLSTTDADAIKSTITRREEEWVPKYKEQVVIYPRRSLFWGTTNTVDFLTDLSGNRRWLPFEIAAVIDVDAIKRDRDQLWAEAAATWRAVDWSVEKLADFVRRDFTQEHLWVGAIEQWLDTEAVDGLAGVGKTYRQRGWFSTSELVDSGVLRVGGKVVNMAELSKVMTHMGWYKERSRHLGSAARRWRPIQTAE